MAAERFRVLIWGKTYPELSTKYQETVCTGGVREDGTPVRLYPVSFRYVNEEQQYKLYDWVEVEAERNQKDPRPESFKVHEGQIWKVGYLDSHDSWRGRREVIFQRKEWQFDSVQALKNAQATTGRSLGIVTPGEIVSVKLEPKSPSDRAAYQEKLAQVQAQPDFFRPEFKSLDYPDHNIRLEFRCSEPCTCSERPHSMKILDWGTLELARKAGWEAARKKVESLADLAQHELRIFMGNFRLHLTNFGIVGLWYPKIAKQTSLF